MLVHDKLPRHFELHSLPNNLASIGGTFANAFISLKALPARQS